MSKILSIVFIIAGFGLMLTYQNCGQPEEVIRRAPTGKFTISGTVSKTNLVDGCQALIISNADDKSAFIPYGIDPATLLDGQKVTVTGSVAQDVYSICMAGVIMKIDKIEQGWAGPTINQTSHHGKGIVLSE